MDDREYEYWFGYIRETADQMGLKDWDIRLERGTAADGNAADIHTWHGQRRATMRLDLDLFRAGDLEALQDQRRNVVHELLHCHVAVLDKTIEIGCEQAGSDPRWELTYALYRERCELLIDTLATVWAPFFDLPETGALYG